MRCRFAMIQGPFVMCLADADAVTAIRSVGIIVSANAHPVSRHLPNLRRMLASHVKVSANMLTRAASLPCAPDPGRAQQRSWSESHASTLDRRGAPRSRASRGRALLAAAIGAALVITALVAGARRPGRRDRAPTAGLVADYLFDQTTGSSIPNRVAGGAARHRRQRHGQPVDRLLAGVHRRRQDEHHRRTGCACPTTC